jgi:hypothetical protein
MHPSTSSSFELKENNMDLSEAIHSNCSKLLQRYTFLGIEILSGNTLHTVRYFDG